ncbi:MULTISPECIES: tyrosine-type recombinase/integrase [Cysteiniphilum]|uniref:Integrase n=1 Tax=Cysteiniphilum litorale TaxID=2056700 RepID=A0A8J3E998_9GAMM|nr:MULTISPECIES: tyrosine-type recombinase/integrase [Cysteiniphilum]GGF97700.1 integrase [Cysteiniphilum litorale]
MSEKISAKKMAVKIAKLLKPQQPNYDYLRDVFKFVRQDLNIEVTTKTKQLPYVPTEDEIKKIYQVIWDTKDPKHILITKVFLYTGVRVSELVKIKLADVDLNQCRIRINQGKGKKDRMVPFPQKFKEALVIHMEQYKKENRIYLFESGFHRHYSDRGIRRMFMRYTEEAKLAHSISPHKLRHFLFTWLKKQNIDDAFIQPYSGHSKRESLEIYSKLSLADAQGKYDDVIGDFPV